MHQKSLVLVENKMLESSVVHYPSPRGQKKSKVVVTNDSDDSSSNNNSDEIGDI